MSTLTKVTHNVLESRYTESSTLSSEAGVTVDSAAANVFIITAGHNITFNFTNVKIGDVKTIIITGGGGSYTLTLGTINGSAGTYNNLGGTYDDTGSTKNILEIKFISASEAWYQISKAAS